MLREYVHILHIGQESSKDMSQISENVSTRLLGFCGTLWGPHKVWSLTPTEVWKNDEKWSSLDRRRPPPFRSIIRFPS